MLIGGFNDDEIPAMAELTRRYPVDVRFIELMPMQTHDEFGPSAFLPVKAVLEQLPEAQPVAPDGGVARLYRLPGAHGNLGLISPVSDHFCADCNSLRLTADGKTSHVCTEAMSFPLRAWAMTKCLLFSGRQFQPNPRIMPHSPRRTEAELDET